MAYATIDIELRRRWWVSPLVAWYRLLVICRVPFDLERAKGRIISGHYFRTAGSGPWQRLGEEARR